MDLQLGTVVRRIAWQALVAEVFPVSRRLCRGDAHLHEGASGPNGKPDLSLLLEFLWRRRGPMGSGLDQREPGEREALFDRLAAGVADWARFSATEAARVLHAAHVRFRVLGFHHGHI